MKYVYNFTFKTELNIKQGYYSSRLRQNRLSDLFCCLLKNWHGYKLQTAHCKNRAELCIADGGSEK